MKRLAPATAAPQRLAPPPNLPGHVHLFEPDEDLEAELVLSGPHGAAVETVLAELRHVERFLEAGIDAPTRILFDGPSGTGKTLTARWLGWKLKTRVLVLDISATVGKHLGETSAAFGEAFEAADRVGAMLFLDEADAICARRDDSGESSAAAEMARATSTLLQQLDWLAPDRIVIAATNFRERIDPALARRLPTQVTFALPDRDARLRMVQRWLERAPVPLEVVERLADESEGLSGSDLRAAAMAAGRRAVMAAPPAPKKKDNGITLRDGAQGVLGVLEGLS